MRHCRTCYALAASVLLLLFHPGVSTKLSEFHVQEAPLDKVPPPPVIDLSEVLTANDNASSCPQPQQQQHQQQQQQQTPREMVPDRDEDEEDERSAKKRDPSKSSSTGGGSVFNFASHTAGAVVLAVSPAAKGFSNLLDDDMDRYGISPCDEKKWVVIGLSEDILVTSVVIANYERYSSMLKDFQLLASTIYPTEEWINLGTYVASPRLGEQTFNVTQTSAHTRYVKLKFLTHYDNEALCTLSQIKVHGTTVIASFKEEVELSDTDMRSMLFTLSDEVEGVAGTNASEGLDGNGAAGDAVQALQSTGSAAETQGEAPSSPECASTSSDKQCLAPAAPAGLASGAVNGTLQTPVAAAGNATSSVASASAQANVGDATDKAPATEAETGGPSSIGAPAAGAGAAAAAGAAGNGAASEPASEAAVSASIAQHPTSDTDPPAEAGSAASSAGVSAGLARHSLETVVKSVKDIVTPLLTIAPLVPPLTSSSSSPQQQQQQQHQHQTEGSGDAAVNADELAAATIASTPQQSPHQPQPPATERSAVQEDSQSSGAAPHAAEADAGQHSSSAAAPDVSVAAESSAASTATATPLAGADKEEESTAASGAASSSSSSSSATTAAGAGAEEAASPSTTAAAAAEAAAGDARDDVGAGPMVVGPAAHLGRGIETVVKSVAEIVTPLLAVNPNPNPNLSPPAGSSTDDTATSLAVHAGAEGQEQHLAEKVAASAPPASASASAPDASTSTSVEQGASAGDIGASSVDSSSSSGSGSGEKGGEHIASELSLQAAERTVDAMTKHVVLLGSAATTATVPVSSAAVSTACADLMRFSDFNAKMLAKLQAAAKPTEDRPVPLTGVHENVFRVLMAKIKSLEMSQAILEMYTGQLGDCYRSVEVERRAGERDELRLAEDLAARVRGRFENEVRLYLVVCVLGAAAGILALFRSSPSLFGSTPAPPASTAASAPDSALESASGEAETEARPRAARSRSGQGRRRA